MLELFLYSGISGLTNVLTNPNLRHHGCCSEIKQVLLKSCSLVYTEATLSIQHCMTLLYCLLQKEVTVHIELHHMHSSIKHVDLCWTDSKKRLIQNNVLFAISSWPVSCPCQSRSWHTRAVPRFPQLELDSSPEYLHIGCLPHRCQHNSCKLAAFLTAIVETVHLRLALGSGPECFRTRVNCCCSSNWCWSWDRDPMNSGSIPSPHSLPDCTLKYFRNLRSKNFKRICECHQYVLIRVGCQYSMWLDNDTEHNPSLHSSGVAHLNQNS